MFSIVDFLPPKKKRSPTGFWNFNAVCCHHNGERTDTRMRGGVHVETDGSFNYSCFNCGFKTGFKWGEKLSLKARKFLIWLGVDDATIDLIQLESLRHRTINGLIQETVAPIKPKKIWFPEVELPPEYQVVDQDNPDHKIYSDYLKYRSVDPVSYAFLVNPDGEGRDKTKILIPFTYKNKIVGHTSRFMDGRIPKYIHSMPSGYAFGTDLQHPTWNRVIIVEGVFDALAIDGIAVLHSTISEEQHQLISRLRKEVIVVPDQDKAGMKMADKAVEYGWSVSMPEWDEDVKDVADAVQKYGKLGALITIMAAAESNPLKIQLRRKRFA